MFMNPQPSLEDIRHSLAHLLAAAVLKKWPDTKLGIGPVIENGFYYDFQFTAPISDADLKDLEKQMKKSIGGKLHMIGETATKEEALSFFKQQPFKRELIEEFAKDNQDLTIYSLGADSKTTSYQLQATSYFSDLCRGGHVTNTSEIDPDAFKLTKLAGAYWRGDEKNAQLTRIYGVAFETKADLDAYVKMMAEAEKRDHKKLGPELDLFVFSPLVGSGLPLWTPKGTLMRNLLNDFVWSLRKARGYERVEIPHITKKDLYVTSGHWEKFKDDLFKIATREKHEFAMKPMNCPHHTQIYNRKKWSYRELPQRYESTTMVYRDEQSGELAGLSRVLSITQDDAHVFCRMSSFKEEALKVWEIIHEFYGAFGIDLKVRLSTRDPKHPEKYLGDSAHWEKAESVLREIINDKKVSFIDGAGEAAFYGPKLDFMGKDAIGREHQVATIQLDFNQPERFDLSCVNEKGEDERIVMLHAAIMGSIERFMALLIEHYAGVFPLWLSPIQARVIAISEKFQDYGAKILAELRTTGIRAELADSNETLGKRIRAAQIEKIPYVLVVGEEEQNSGTVAVRHLKAGDLGKLSSVDLISRIHKEINEKI
jgi:threonyl-tRNA synthetase